VFNPALYPPARCLFEAFISIISKAQVQMCFAPVDEQGFFSALGAGLFDAKALCSTIDAMKATASVADDKTMIMKRIKKEVGLESYNEQVRQFLEQQYKFVALRGRGRQGKQNGGAATGQGGSSNAQHSAGGQTDGFVEVLKHLRRIDTRLGTMEKNQQAMEKTQQAMEKKQEMAASELQAIHQKLDANSSPFSSGDK
jgi:hypothetical protein